MWGSWALLSSNISSFLSAAMDRFHEGLQLVYYLGKLGHEAGSQMAILKHHPASVKPHLRNDRLCLL